MEPLTALVVKCIALYAQSAEVQRFYGLTQRLHALILKQSAQRPVNWYCRFDFTIDDAGVPQVMEFNGDCPAGLLQQQHYQALLSSSVLGRYEGRGPAARTLIEDLDFVPSQIEDLLGSIGKKIAILNSRHHTLRNEIELFRDTLTRAGHSCRLGFIEDVKFRDRRLWLDQQPIDLVLTKLDPQLENMEGPPVGADWRDIAEFEKAIDAGAVLVLNSVASSIVAETKETLALLHCDWFQALLSESERSLVRACIPLTIRLDHLDTSRLQNIFADKDGWIVKKCMDTRGRSVVLGSEETVSKWRGLLLEYSRTGARKYVVQRRVRAIRANARAFPTRLLLR